MRDSEIANPLNAKFGDYLSKINQTLQKELELYSWSEFYSPLKYACDNGKRIRPLILVLSAEIINSKKNPYSLVDDNVFTAASAIELLHTESVIHDDIIDEERIRRGRPSFHVKYGYNNSILTADFVLGIILHLSSKLNNPKVSTELANAAIKMSDGEMMEIKLTENNKITENDYIKVLENKTGSLFEASARIGAILGGGDEHDIQSLGNFGSMMGISYQIRDDLIDWHNEDRLFNLLMKQNKETDSLVERMEKIYRSYYSKAKNELESVTVNSTSKHIDDLANLTTICF